MSLRFYKDKDRNEKGPARLLCKDQKHCGTGSVLYEEMLGRVASLLEECIEDFEIRLKNDTGDSAKLHTQLIKNLERKMKELSQWEVQSDPDSGKRMRMKSSSS